MKGARKEIRVLYNLPHKDRFVLYLVERNRLVYSVSSSFSLR